MARADPVSVRVHLSQPLNLPVARVTVFKFASGGLSPAGQAGSRSGPIKAAKGGFYVPGHLV
jgi:hypothetical protein